MPTRRTREYASEGTLARMEKALTLVGGSFIAAAKLLDMTPQRFRNIIHSNEVLAKWRHTRRGRPSRRLGFHINEYCYPPPLVPRDIEPSETATGFARSLRIRAWILGLPAVDKVELAEWIENSKQLDPDAWRVEPAAEAQTPANP
jgi:hypothetical protein